MIRIRPGLGLTDAQRHNLIAIVEAGGTLIERTFRFYAPGSNEPIKGLNRVAIRSLVRFGVVDYTEATDASKWQRVYTLTERGLRAVSRT